MNAHEALGVYLRGAAMGSVELVPGVSGGTIALITGIYDRLVAAIAAFHPRPLRWLVRPHDPAARAKLVDAWDRMDLTFLLVLGTGMVSAVVVLSKVLSVAMEDYRAMTGAFFVGLIGASVVVIGRDVPWTAVRGALAVAAAALAVGLSLGTESGTTPSLALVFVAGGLAISAMVLPGLSGSLIMLIIGQYDYLIGQLTDFLDGIRSVVGGGSREALVEPGLVVVTFLAGAAIGLVTMARAVEWALERDRATTIGTLVGLMAGGIYPPAEMIAQGFSSSPAGVPVLAALFGLGMAAVVAVDWTTDDLSYV